MNDECSKTTTRPTCKTTKVTEYGLCSNLQRPVHSTQDQRKCCEVKLQDVFSWRSSTQKSKETLATFGGRCRQHRRFFRTRREPYNTSDKDNPNNENYKLLSPELMCSSNESSLNRSKFPISANKSNVDQLIRIKNRDYKTEQIGQWQHKRRRRFSDSDVRIAQKDIQTFSLLQITGKQSTEMYEILSPQQQQHSIDIPCSQYPKPVILSSSLCENKATGTEQQHNYEAVDDKRKRGRHWTEMGETATNETIEDHVFDLTQSFSSGKRARKTSNRKAHCPKRNRSGGNVNTISVSPKQVTNRSQINQCYDVYQQRHADRYIPTDLMKRWTLRQTQSEVEDEVSHASSSHRGHVNECKITNTVTNLVGHSFAQGTADALVQMENLNRELRVASSRNPTMSNADARPKRVQKDLEATSPYCCNGFVNHNKHNEVKKHLNTIDCKCSIQFIEKLKETINKEKMIKADKGGGLILRFTLLQGVRIAGFKVGGEKRLCLSDVIASALKRVPLIEIERAMDDLGIYVQQCNPRQIHQLIVKRIIPIGSSSCGLISQANAERLCHQLLHCVPTTLLNEKNVKSRLQFPSHTPLHLNLLNRSRTTTTTSIQWPVVLNRLTDSIANTTGPKSHFNKMSRQNGGCPPVNTKSMLLLKERKDCTPDNILPTETTETLTSHTLTTTLPDTNNQPFQQNDLSKNKAKSIDLSRSYECLSRLFVDQSSNFSTSLSECTNTPEEFFTTHTTKFVNLFSNDCYSFIPVNHNCSSYMRGFVFMTMYKEINSPCIQCRQCKWFYSPQDFVCHEHIRKAVASSSMRKQQQVERLKHVKFNKGPRLVHWGLDSNKWRSYIEVDLSYADMICAEYKPTANRESVWRSLISLWEQRLLKMKRIYCCNHNDDLFNRLNAPSSSAFFQAVRKSNELNGLPSEQAHHSCPLSSAQGNNVPLVDNCRVDKVIEQNNRLSNGLSPPGCQLVSSNCLSYGNDSCSFSTNTNKPYGELCVNAIDKQTAMLHHHLLTHNYYNDKAFKRSGLAAMTSLPLHNGPTFSFAPISNPGAVAIEIEFDALQRHVCKALSKDSVDRKAILSDILKLRLLCQHSSNFLLQTNALLSYSVEQLARDNVALKNKLEMTPQATTENSSLNENCTNFQHSIATTQQFQAERTHMMDVTPLRANKQCGEQGLPA